MEMVECCEVPECTTPVIVPGGEEASCVDWCIVPELKMLWGLGIRTFCSCCGHGNYEEAYIRVDNQAYEIMEALGYEPYEPHKCIFHGRNTKSYRAKLVRLVHEKGMAPEKRGIDEIRCLWKKTSHYGGKDYV